jgi:hypothetical protein
VLGLLGILEAGRGIPAPLSISGDWTVEFDSPVCAKAASAPPPALSISQSGVQALVTLNDGHASTQDATVDGPLLTAKSLTARISGKPDERRLEGKMDIPGCGPVAFHAARQIGKKRGV